MLAGSAMLGAVGEGWGWRALSESDLGVLGELSAEALAVDGGSPFAADEWWMRRWYIDGVEASFAVVREGELAGASARRAAAEPGGPVRIAGQVRPAFRGQGLGGRLLDAALAGVDPDEPVVVETETLTAAADRLFASRGLRQAFAEDVMAMPLPGAAPSQEASLDDLVLTPWTAELAPRFYEVWHEAFADRPGFPDWPAGTWIEWISDDPDFRADWTLLASVGGRDVGFVAGATGGWIVQTGVVPEARGRRICAAMLTEVFGRMTAVGETRTVLTVNINNPAAISAYERLGYERIGRRARYERAPDGQDSMTSPAPGSSG
jgi:ribosomal protein S18 acetylase RimI-like enzyme